ncbi:hypothetical protein GCM10010156_26590 [Planobispora rosea]|uniref:Signal transduction histidine kinase subgroup 3 dimerisation and phosphoacceptor domain-containing protein n=1 Tax=Planobispora rosea TaxID=35762 RepID=A0A8J3WEJ3_PLARO|nr:histidine kinase [Planobispora rosea]GGS66417.1 hypothetical protein GCM10010156_26590 [Planobispora rosea]GIH85021.1 hypothetical protein Pro02_34290 [Planobispora rosea]
MGGSGGPRAGALPPLVGACSPVLFVLLGAVSAFVALFRMEPMPVGGAPMSAFLVIAVYAAQVLVALRGRSWRAVAVQGVLCWAPVVVFRGNWVVLDGFLAAAVLGAGHRVLRWPLFVLAAAAGTALHARVFPMPWPEAGQELAALWTILNVGAFAYGVPRLAGLVRRLHETRDELARLALVQERLRSSTRLHEVLGASLATVTVTLGRTSRRLHAALRVHETASRVPVTPGARRQDWDAPAVIPAAALHGVETGLETVSALARETLSRVRETADSYREPVVSPPDEDGDAPRAGWIVIGMSAAALVIWPILDIPHHRIVALTVLVAIAAVHITMVARPHRAGWLLPLQALLALAPLPLFGPDWMAATALLGASILVAQGGPGAWPLAAAAGALGAFWPQAGMDGIDHLHRLLPTWLWIIAFAVLSQLTRLLIDLADARARVVRMTVLTERLRVAKDVHDLMGFGLSAVALKCDLARRLLATDPVAARAHLAEALRIAGEAGRDLASLARGDRELSLEEEIAAARRVLASAGIEVRAGISGAVPACTGSVLAPVLREAVTNILRHSAARRVVITCVTDGPVRLRVTNDGAAASSAAREGTGLANLEARVSAVGGRLLTERECDRFSVVAVVPVPQQGAAAPRGEAPVPREEPPPG